VGHAANFSNKNEVLLWVMLPSFQKCHVKKSGRGKHTLFVNMLSDSTRKIGAGL
jgi:hypothetical protein